MDDGAKKLEKLGWGKPTLDQVRRYFVAYEFIKEEGELFFFFHRSTCWRSQSGDRIGDWTLAAKRWMWNLEN
jgi:hypothetical protein